METPAGGKLKKNKYVVIGGGVGIALVLYGYWRRKKNAAAATDSGTVDPNAIDPATGIPYGQESGYGGNYLGASVPNPYVSAAGTNTVNTTAYTSNVAWLADAIQYATGYFQASPVLAASATGKYLAQNASGLNPSEYSLVQQIVALIGPPPVGTFRLIQAAPSQNPSGGGGTTQHTIVYVADGKTSLDGLASRYQVTPASIIAATTPHQPADVAAYLALGAYSRALRAGTHWYVPQG